MNQMEFSLNYVATKLALQFKAGLSQRKYMVLILISVIFVEFYVIQRFIWSTFNGFAGVELNP